jgi:formamidopyrimidine-DNA glycosylase
VPELPDITVYVEALERRIAGARLISARLAHPFVLRTVDPPLAALEGRGVERIRRLGKRIAIGFEGELWLVLHLMIAGRLHWIERGAGRRGAKTLAAFDFERGTLTLTEAGAKRRASIHVVAGEAGLAAHDRGGLEIFEAALESFRARLTARNHTLKRALTEPRILSGIGNAYSDEILHRAGLSPLAQTHKLSDEEVARLFDASRAVLAEWTRQLREETSDHFPEGVTAFRPGMAVHGRFGEPCPVCAAIVQRIRYAENETNYCPRCQTGGRILADRSLSRLLKDDWPRTLEELEGS